MDTIKTFFEALYHSPHYSFGWIIAAILAILPAIVSVNLIQHDLGKLITEKGINKTILYSLLQNLLIMLVSLSVISYAFYLYFW